MRRGLEPPALSLERVSRFAAGAVWRAPYPAYIGAWLALVGVTAACVPAPVHFLVLGIAGGGAFLLAGILIAAWAWKRVK